MTGALLVLSGAVYLVGVARWDRGHPGSRFPRARVAAFVAGLLVLGAALEGPVERLSLERFAWHMAQHLAVTLLASPLLLLGRPLLLARRTSPPVVRRTLARAIRSRTVAVLSHPVVAWAAFVLVLWASHFTSLYQAAIRSSAVHVGEHALYLGASLLFWLPVVGAEPSRHHVSYPARLLYLFLAGPAGALLASTLHASGRVLYAPYAGPGALGDQRAAGAIMWIGGGLAFLAAGLLVAAGWARADRAEAARADASAAQQERSDRALGAGEDGRVAIGQRPVQR